MSFYASLPLLFLKFYVFELPLMCIKWFASFNHSFLELVSLPLLVRTFFKPWKNEYRQRFIPVAVGLGMSIKSCVIIADLFMLSILLFAECVLIIFVVLWPILTVLLLLR